MRIIADIYALKMFIAKLQTCFIAYDEIVILLMGDNVFLSHEDSVHKFIDDS